MSKCIEKSNHCRYGGSGDHEWSRNRTKLTDEQRELAGRSIGMAGAFAKKMWERRFGGFTRDELFEIGCEGLVLAARSFRPGEGNRFITYAFTVMRRRAGMEAKNNHIIRVPYHSREEAAIRAVRRRFLSAGDVDVDIIDRPAPEPSSEYEDTELDRLVAGLTRLDRRSRDILTRRAEGETLKEISQSYHISRQRVRQISVAAIESLRRCMGIETPRPTGRSRRGEIPAGDRPEDREPQRPSRGPRWKLDWAMVAEIRSLYEGGELQKNLAKKFGVSVVTINDVVHFKSWTEDAPCA